MVIVLENEPIHSVGGPIAGPVFALSPSSKCDALGLEEMHDFFSFRR